MHRTRYCFSCPSLLRSCAAAAYGIRPAPCTQPPHCQFRNAKPERALPSSSRLSFPLAHGRPPLSSSARLGLGARTRRRPGWRPRGRARPPSARPPTRTHAGAHARTRAHTHLSREPVDKRVRARMRVCATFCLGFRGVCVCVRDLLQPDDARLFVLAAPPPLQIVCVCE